MSSTYNYRPLPSTSGLNPIRLLKLYPALNCHDGIRCELKEKENIRKCSYEALSYVWGVRVGDRRIDCEGETLLVTQNCEEALRRLRRTKKVRTLWVDSVCINQSSNEEKSAQVNLMGEIYGGAKMVLVWLGEYPDNDAGNTTIRNISWFSNVFVRDWIWCTLGTGSTYQKLKKCLRCA
jgi:hypothetical protein